MLKPNPDRPRVNRFQFRAKLPILDLSEYVIQCSRSGNAAPMRDQKGDRDAEDISVRSSNSIVQPISSRAIRRIVEFDPSVEGEAEQAVPQFEQPPAGACCAKALPWPGKEQDRQRQDDQNLKGME